MEKEEELDLIYKRTHSAFVLDAYQKNDLYFKIKTILDSSDNAENNTAEIIEIVQSLLKDREAGIVDKITNQNYGVIIPGEKKGVFRRIG